MSLKKKKLKIITQLFHFSYRVSQQFSMDPRHLWGSCVIRPMQNKKRSILGPPCCIQRETA